MPNLEHANLTGSQLHEPKGVSSAASNKVYLADGAGSGSWATPPLSVSNEVIVESLSDFPEPVGSVITLADNIHYRLVGSIDIGTNRLVTGDNVLICGSNSRSDKLISTTTSALVTSSGHLTFVSIGLSVPNGSYIACTGAGANTENFVSRNCAYLACASFGVITNWGLTALTESFSINGSGSLSFAGTHARFSLSFFSFVNTAGTIVDLGTATFNTVYIHPNVTFDIAGSTVGLDVAPASANINSGGRGSIIGCTFIGAGTPTVGIASDDLLWVINGNQGVPDTSIGAQGNIIGSALNTSFSGTGAVNAVPVNFGAAFVADIEDQFTISVAGRLTYIGKGTKLFFADVTLFANVLGGASRQYVFTVAKNDIQIVSSSAKREYTGSTPGAHSVSSLVELAENDYVDLYVYADTATTDLNVDTCSFKVRAK